MVRYLNPAYHNPGRITKIIRITKSDKYFVKGIDFADIIIPGKIRDIYKSKTRVPSTLGFSVMKIKKDIQSICQKNVAKKNMLTYY